LPIAGFDLGNSPAQFTPQSVGGKYVVLTTTNGTKALLHCRLADRILIGSFANLSPLCTRFFQCPRVDLVCAGTDEQVTDEDLLLAGAIAERLAAGGNWKLDESSQRCRGGWQEVVRGARDDELPSRIVTTIRSALGGRNLIKIGSQRDIETAAAIDRFDIVPHFDPATGEVTA
jgi:2-phosphosulfolactate phosphatase